MPTMEKPLYLVPYSALSQGQAISVLVRAFWITSHIKFMDAAYRGGKFMIRTIQDGGTSRITSDGLILEEYPREKSRTVLNGWVSALYGIYDLTLISKWEEMSDVLEASMQALLKYLPKYNAQFWSFYDTSGTISSPYYHRVHIIQLRALERTFPNLSHMVSPLRFNFERQITSASCFSKAFSIKVLQRLRSSPETRLK
jgi:heparosan-N-sulfate-glucuronate 5-epimerase